MGSDYISGDVQLEATKWAIQNLVEGSSDYDFACTLIAQLEPTSQLASQLVQYLYRTSTDDSEATVEEMGDVVQEEPSVLPLESSIERVSRYERPPVI